MWKSIIRSVSRAQRGFTLIELLVVMAVIGVLAGIVTTSVSGTGETSNVAQARSDASTVESAVSSFFTDQEATLVESPKTVAVTAAIASAIDLNTGAITYDNTTSGVTQKKSSRWPEVFITENLNSDATATFCVGSNYCGEFPTAGLGTAGVVTRVVVADSDGAAIGRSTLLGTYTAVDFTTLADLGYVVTVPDSADQTAEIPISSTATITIHNFLWLLRKSTSAGGGAEDDSRSIAVFKLASAKATEAEAPGGNNTVTLSYAQIF
jgi:prepilin-type N-terminal cleavage/methylation domain-containing protein